MLRSPSMTRGGWLIVSSLALLGCAESMERPLPARSCEVGALEALRFPAQLGPTLPDSLAHMCRAYVDREGRLIVGGAFAAAPDWARPWRTHIARRESDGWVPVAPPLTSDEGIQELRGFASSSRALYALLGDRVYAIEDGTFTALRMPGEALEPLALVDGADGWPLTAAYDGSVLRLYELREAGWEAVSDPLRGESPVRSGGRGLAVACDGRTVALMGLSVFELAADGSWRDLGAFSHEPVAYPAVAVSPDEVFVAWSGERGDGYDQVFVARHREGGGGFALVDSPVPARDPARLIVPWVSNRGEVFIAWRETHVRVGRLRGESWDVSPVGTYARLGTVPHLTGGPDGVPVLCWETFGAGAQLETSRAVPAM